MALLILNPYTPGPAAVAERYEPWLRAEDNPTFNAQPGVGEYSNWKVIASPQSWTHFDLFAMADEADVERVWFSPVLERFRSRWVSLWGYGAVPGSGYATLYGGDGEFRAKKRFAELEFDAPGAQWKATSFLRKHWALGPALEGESWRKPVTGTMKLKLHDAAPSNSGACVAEYIAAPGLRHG